MRRIFTFFLTFLLGVFVTALYAQTHTVSGTVIDKDANEPLIGANVLIKGTTIGTVTTSTESIPCKPVTKTFWYSPI